MAEQLTLDQELDALRLPEKKLETPKPEEPKLGETPAPVVEEAKPAEEPVVATLEDKLGEIEEPKPNEAPKVSDDQQKILSAIPDVQTASQLLQAAQSYDQLNSVLSNRDFDKFETMLDPGAAEGLLEHIYKKYVDTGAWVDRFISEHDPNGNPVVQQSLRAMQSKLDQVQSKLAERDRGQSEAQQRAQAQQTFATYQKHVNGLFDKIEFAPADRRWVMDALSARAGADPQIMAQLRNGNPSAVTSLFKQVVREYVNRDKSESESRAALLAAQEKKKPLLPGSQVTPTAGLPRDVKEVPKGKLDAWMDQELAALAGSRKR